MRWRKRIVRMAGRRMTTRKLLIMKEDGDRDEYEPWIAVVLMPPSPASPPPPPPPPSPTLLPTFTKYYKNDPDLRNLLSSDKTINRMMLAAVWKMMMPIKREDQ